jgi:hypothetical protein
MNGYPKATGDFTNDPAAAHARQLKARSGSLVVVRENQSRRDLTKVAQYEVLG